MALLQVLLKSAFGLWQPITPITRWLGVATRCAMDSVEVFLTVIVPQIHVLINISIAEQLWLLSRQKTLSSDLWESIKKNNFANGQFKSEYLLPVDQSNCPTITLVKDTLTEEDLFLLKSP